MALNTAKYLLVVTALLLVPAGTLRYGGAWLYVALNLAWLSVAGVYFFRKDPALVERRLTQDERGEKDALQGTVMATFRALGAIMLVLAGFDHRFGWSTVPIGVVAAGGALFVAGTVVMFAVFVENTYASSIIEVDAAQTVVATGPYRVLRHPFYAGGLLMGLGTPLVLGSYWALLFLPPGWALLVVRILAEERFLSRELRGYAEYMRRTPRRLIPLVW
jgi:protein-S-isoprenylcysteine O-methyltransferase Ste14